MTSKVLSYWTNNVKWPQTVQPAAGYWTVDQENLGMRLSYFWWAEKQIAKWQNSFKNREILWVNKNAIIEFDFHRTWTILQISGCYPPRPSASMDNSLLDLQNSSYSAQPYSIMAKYTTVFLHSDWLYFLWHDIKICIPLHNLRYETWTTRYENPQCTWNSSLWSPPVLWNSKMSPQVYKGMDFFWIYPLKLFQFNCHCFWTILSWS